MKLNRGFVIGVVTFLVLVFIAEMRVTSHFVWEPSFRHDDRQPFGCYVMDSLLAASLPGGYSVTDKTFYQLSQEKDSVRRSFVVLCPDFIPSEVEFKSMLTLLERGDNILVLSDDIDVERRDSIFGFGVRYGLSLYGFQRRIRNNYVKDSLLWVGDGSHYPERVFRYAEPLLTGGISIVDSSRVETLAYTVADAYSEVCAVAVECGKGRIVFCTNPLLFTNYGMLETGNHDFVFRVFSQLGDRPVVRTESVLRNASDGIRGQSPLTFFLHNQPLRWAIYTALAGILLYFVFTARRRQRVIPVVKSPANRSLEFVRLIGTLYHQRHDNTGLVRKKFVCFAETLRREVMVDIGNEEEDEANAEQIAAHTGMDVKEILADIHELRVAMAFEGNMKDVQMKHCIDIMNKILGRCTLRP